MKDDDVKNLEATGGNKLVRLSEREGRDLLNEDLDIVELSINEVQSSNKGLISTCEIFRLMILVILQFYLEFCHVPFYRCSLRWPYLTVNIHLSPPRWTTLSTVTRWA